MANTISSADDSIQTTVDLIRQDIGSRTERKIMHNQIVILMCLKELGERLGKE